MKNNFLNWFSKHDDSIFCIVIASVATAVEHYIVGKHPDYMLFFSILAIGFMLVKVVRILFWKNHKRLFLTFLCATINIVIINHFYSYQQFLATFPFLATYDPWILLLGVSGSILAVLLVVRLSISTLPKLFSGSADGEKMSFSFLKKRCSSTNKTKEGACKPAPDKSETIIIEPHGRKLISAGDKGGKDFPPRRKVNVGAILAIVACIIALGVLGLGSYNLIQVIMHEIRQNSEMNYENITSRIFPYILCWGIVSILLLLSNDKDGIDLLKKQYTKGIPIPDPVESGFVETKQDWKNTWRNNYTALLDVLRKLPGFYIPSSTEDIDKAQIDISFLKSFSQEKDEIENEIENMMRDKLSDISILERAFILLKGKYRGTAIFSIILAFFFDGASLLAGIFIFYVEMPKDNRNILENTA